MRTSHSLFVLILVTLCAGCATSAPPKPTPHVLSATQRPDMLTRLGDDMRRNGDTAGAIDLYRAASQTNPHDAAPLGRDAGADTAINGAFDWAGPVGAGLSLLAQFGLVFKSALDQKNAQNALQSQGQQFLEDGLGLRPAVANQLADVSDNQHQGPASVLLAYAHQYDIQPSALLKYLNGKNPNDVGNLVYVAELMTPNKDGQYQATSPSDTHNNPYQPGVPFANTVPDFGDSTGDLPNNPESLRQIQYWMETIFGPNGPPTS